MPRGVPAAGYRKTKARQEAKPVQLKQVPTLVVSNETDAQIEERINDRFEILEDLTNAAIKSDVRAVIVSGPAGLGKSYTVEEALKKWDPQEKKHTIIKGYVRAPSLYKLLYSHSRAGQVLVFDDADTVFQDDTSLNMLKAVCDSSKSRRVSYMTEGVLYDEDTAERLPKSFSFEGTIIFISNLDFDGMIEKGHRLAPHLQAMMSRSHYIDLALKTKRDYMIRIRQVLKQGLLDQTGLDKLAQDDVVNFLEVNRDSLRELSLRIALKVAAVRKMNTARWEKTAKVTCCK
jgi:hypothetical protein